MSRSIKARRNAPVAIANRCSRASRRELALRAITHLQRKPFEIASLRAEHAWERGTESACRKEEEEEER